MSVYDHNSERTETTSEKIASNSENTQQSNSPHPTHRSLVGAKEVPIRQGFLGAKFRRRVLTVASRVTGRFGFSFAAIAVVQGLSIHLLLFAGAPVKAVVIVTAPDTWNFTVRTIPRVVARAVFRGAGIGPKAKLVALILLTRHTCAIVLALERTRRCFS